MRIALAVLVALASLSASMPAAAGPAAPPDGARLLTDPAGDEAATVQGQVTPVTRWAASDLQSLDVQESKGAYNLTLAVRALGAENAPQADDVFYDVYFHAATAPYEVGIFYDASAGTAQASLETPDPKFGFYREVAPLTVTVDKTQGTFSFAVDHSILLRPDGAPLMRGDVLDSFYAEATAQGGSIVEGFTAGTLQMHDRMPDAGLGTQPWAVRTGPEQHGTVVAASPAPVRVSNGEATTFLFQLRLKNVADHSDTFQLAASHVPSNWVITFPQPDARIEAGAELTIPILATVPFAHVHGTFATFNVTAQSHSDPLTYADLQFGVRYTAVPQPAGHHDTVVLHGASDRQQWINTLDTDSIPAGETTAAPSFGGGCSFSGPSGSGTSALVPLFPGLEMGLDFDMARNGTADVVLHSDTPVVSGYSIGGYFLVWTDDAPPETCIRDQPATAVALLQHSAPVSISAGQNVTVKLGISPLPYGDYVARAAGLHFGLLLALYQEGVAHEPICCTGTGQPTFVAGSTFQLPLNEYHDPVSSYFSTLSGIDLTASSGQQRLVNPGKAVVFHVTAENIGKEAGVFDLELKGSHTDWARILGDNQVSLDAGAKRELAVAITPPADAPDGELIDLTLNAVSHHDANVRSLIRLLATVDTQHDQPDDSAQVPGLDASLSHHKSPAGSPLLVFATLSMLALVRRRRRA